VGNIKPQKNAEINYKEGKTPLEKAGAFIKEARQGRSISIEELSGSLRIGKEQLIALENGQEELLPERVFVKAMIRRVSEKLEIDTDFILKELQGRDLSINTLYKSNSTTSNKINTFKLMPIIIISSGLLGIIASLFTINYIENSLPSLNPSINSSRKLPSGN
tara:strand:+ start:20 stop:508 length:489 start_codon:yes stop_codon:yes gene_type:complete